jgi:hypothetical protein
MNSHSDSIVNSRRSLLARLNRIENRVDELEIATHNHLIPQDDKIFELENMVNPYSSSGQAICNYFMEDDDEH